MKKSKYLLSFTWGLPMTLIGMLTAGALLLIGYKPVYFRGCPLFFVGEKWGGVNLGLVIVVSKSATISAMNHEYGHALQNCLYGPLMPFIVGIPSVIRYWYRRMRKINTGYYDIWFERQATDFGLR